MPAERCSPSGRDRNGVLLAGSGRLMAHHDRCPHLDVPPWRWRSQARNTGRKCERRQTSGKDAILARRQRAMRRSLRAEMRGEW
jgi:nitrite reductase/ring-hydroxylating ferredoxin subunit